jgi:hypothetical protein
MLRTPGRRDDFLKSVAATGCLACSGYLAPALTSAIINSREINLAGAIELSGLTFLLMWVAGCWLLQLSGRQGPRLRIACVLLALICVINSSVFLWDFGPFDGRQIALSNHLPKVLAELGALAMIALIAKFFHASIGSRVLSLSVAVALMSFAPLIDQLRGIRPAVGAYLDSSSVVFDFKPTISFVRSPTIRTSQPHLPALPCLPTTRAQRRIRRIRFRQCCQVFPIPVTKTASGTAPRHWAAGHRFP